MELAYVHDGLQGNAMKWQAQLWVATQGPVINVDLWMELLHLLEDPKAEFVWVEVPSHVQLEGSDRADPLAALGRWASPLSLTVNHPAQAPVSPPRPIQGEGSATPKTAVEPTPLVASDEFTPLLLRPAEHSAQHNELTPGCLFHP